MDISGDPAAFDQRGNEAGLYIKWKVAVFTIPGEKFKSKEYISPEFYELIQSKDYKLG